MYQYRGGYVNECMQQGCKYQMPKIQIFKKGGTPYPECTGMKRKIKMVKIQIFNDSALT
jgi:hypothetical protein